MLPAPLLFRTTSTFDRIFEVAQAVLVVSIVRAHSPEHVYYFSCFGRTANLVAYLISINAETRVVRIPSPNPLISHYRVVVCDEFLLTSPLQIPEYDLFRRNWFVPIVRLWKPPGHVGFPRKSFDIAPTDMASIGVISGGQWRRKERGDLFDAERMKQWEAERNLHLAIGDFLREHPDVTVTVYPHPSEKVDAAAFVRATEIYTERIGVDRVQILGSDERTHGRFHDSNVLVSLWSTSAVEALYCGHKVLFAQLGCSAKVRHSSLDNIHVHDRETLLEKLSEVLELSTEEYFKRNELEQFRHDHYVNGPTVVSDDVSDDIANNRLARRL